MAYGLPAIGEANWGGKVSDSIAAVKATADAALPTTAHNWTPATAYAVGDVRQAPDGSTIRRNAAGTSGAAFDAPLAAPVLNAPTTATTGGTLAAGTYYYKITATNALGETVGSNEVSQATTGTTSTVGLSWAAISGATGYKVYRATTSGGQSTSPALLATVGAVTSYTDTGAAVAAGAVPSTNTTSEKSKWTAVLEVAGTMEQVALSATYAPQIDPEFTGQGHHRQLSGATATDVYTFDIQRHALYAGGDPAWVNNTLRVITHVGPDVAAYEWGISAVLHNQTTGGLGQNTASYFQGSRESTTAGATFASVIEFIDTTGASDPAYPCVALEVDMDVNGTDINNLRVGVDVHIGTQGTPGTGGEAYAGVRIGQLDPSKGSWNNCLLIYGTNGVGIKVESAVTHALWITGASSAAAIRVAGTSDAGLRISGVAAVAAIDITGAQSIGLRLDGGTYSTAAIRFGRGQGMAFESSSYFKQYLDASLDVMQFSAGGTPCVGLGIGNPGTLLMNGTQVVTTRRTGWGAATGTATRSTFATGSVTLPQLAERVKALIDDLTTHGLIGA